MEGTPARPDMRMSTIRLSIAEQGALGLFLSGAAWTGITTRSFDSAFPLLTLSAFLVVLAGISRGLKSCGKGVRPVALVAAFGCAAIVVCAGLALAERLYLMNGSAYPRWLASGDFRDGDSLEFLRSRECKERGAIELFGKAEGTYVLRCGFLWHKSKTFIARHNPMRLEQ